MKRVFALLLALAMVLALAACGSKDPADDAKPMAIRVAGMKGPTSMGMVKLMEDDEKSESFHDYAFTIATSADEITPKLKQGEFDIAAVPANLASILYNNMEGQVKLLAINTLGVVYIVEKGNTVQSLADLKGKTIYATGKGTTPEYALNYLLSESGLDMEKDVTMEWKSEPTEVVQILKKAESGVAMLPQPFVTVAQGNVEGLRVAADLNRIWKDLDNGSMFLTGTLVVRTEFAQKNPEALAAFLKEYAASTKWVNENPGEAAKLVEKAGIVKADVAQKAIPYCNITCITGKEMQPAMNGYLKVLLDCNEKSVGGKLPDEAFYYVG